MLGLTSIVHVHIVRLSRFPSAGFLAEAATVSSTGHHLRDKVVQHLRRQIKLRSTHGDGISSYKRSPNADVSWNFE